MDAQDYVQRVYKIILGCSNELPSTEFIMEIMAGELGELFSPRHFHEACDMLAIPSLQEESKLSV